MDWEEVKKCRTILSEPDYGRTVRYRERFGTGCISQSGALQEKEVRT